jgi:uncharacterized repeat protein (TIGR01451 family)
MRIALLLLAFFSLTATASAQVSFTRSNTTGTSAIPDNQCFTGFGQKTINVTDIGTLLDLEVGVVADHTWRGDLQVQLISPLGTNRTIINGVGGNADNLNVRLRDGATTIAGNAHPNVATYANTSNVRGPSNALSAFNGEIITGIWTLRICDSAGADTGSLRQFHLHMTTPTPGPTADLSLAISPTSATRSPGQETSFTITLNNDGPNPVSGVSVDAFLPTGLAHVSNDGGGNYNVASGLWTVPGPIPVGGVRTLNIVASASASGSGVFTTEVFTSGTIDLDSTPDNRALAPNEDDTATANITLVAPTAAPPDPLSCAAPGMMSWPGQTWAAGTLTNSYSADDGTPFDFTFSNDTGFFVNNAAFGGQTPLLSNLLTGGQPSATSLLYVVNFDTSARQVDLDFDVGVAGVGVDSLQFGMFDVDENPDTTANINFIDRMTVTASLGGVSVPVTISGGPSNSVAGNVVTGIAASASATSDGNMWVTISQPVDNVLIEYDNDPAVNPSPGQQGVGLHTIEFCPQAADLALAKDIDNAAPVTGTDVIYTITVENEGTLAATAVEVTDLLPAGLNFVSATPSQGSYTASTGLWTVGSLAPTATATLTITATVTATTGTITNEAGVTSMAEPDLDSTPNDKKGDDYDTADLTVTTAAPELTSEKTVEVFDPTGSGDAYAIPGNDVIYSISITNTGNIAIDNNSLFLVDNFPTDIVFFNGDIDGAGPETDPVIMETTGSPGVTFSYGSDVRFSDSLTAPTNVGQCSYGATPNAYDANVRFICFTPQGSFAATDPDSTIVFKFRARIPAN